MSYPHDFADDLTRSSKTLSQDLIYKLILAYQKSLEHTENDIIEDQFVYSPLIDLHDTEITFNQTAINETDFTNHINGPRPYFIKKPTTIRSYSLVHDLTNAGGLTYETLANSKFRGGVITDGASWFQINHHSSLTPAAGMVITFWLKVSDTTPVSGKQVIFEKGDETGGRYGCTMINGRLRFFVTIDNQRHTVIQDIPEDEWCHFTFLISAFGLYVHVNHESGANGEVVSGNALTHNTEPLTFFKGLTTDTHLQADVSMAWFTFGNGFIQSSDIPDLRNGILNYTGYNEILTIPFIQSLKPQPNATSGLCKSR